MVSLTRLRNIFLLLFALAACTSLQSTDNTSASSCPITKPLWLKPPEDSAIPEEPAFGYFFVNEDRSMWASAWWTDQEDHPLRATKEGIKMGWFRPARVPLEITGRRIDAEAPPLEADIPAAYPTRFQATGLYFPTEGCWEVNAKAGASELSFIVWVAPDEK